MFAYNFGKLCCILFVLLNIRTSLQQDFEDDEMINYAVKIANNNFNYRQLTKLIYMYSEEKLATKFIVDYHGCLTIGNKDFEVSATQVVIIIDSHQSFTSFFNKLSGRSLIGGARILIVINTIRKKLKHVTMILWSYHITDVVIVTRDRKDRIALYTYYPYKNPTNCQNTEPVLIDYWNANNSEDYHKHLYPDKMQNMNRCPVYVSTNKIYPPATERKIPLQQIKKALVGLLRDAMNFTPIISVRDYISLESDRAKNWSYSLNDVISGVANISTCTIPLGVDSLGLLQYSMPYFRVRLAWFTPPVAPGPAWWRLLSPLNGYLWLVLLVVIFLVISLPIIFKFKPVRHFYCEYFRIFSKIQGAAFKVWGVMMGQPIRVAPVRFRDFYIMSLWLWFTFVVRNAYQSVLIGALKTETLVGNFASLKEALDEGYRFGGRAGIYTHFELDPLIRDGFEIVPEVRFEEVFRDVIESKNKFVLAGSLEYVYAFCLALGKKDKDCLHVLPDSILTVPLVVWMRMQSPLVNTLSVWLPRFIESGLLERDEVIKTSYSATTTSDPSPLTMHQLLSCFSCLAFGYIVSTVVLFLEMLRFKTSKYVIVEKCRIGMINVK